MITNGDRLAVIEAFYVSYDLGQDTTEAVADGDVKRFVCSIRDLTLSLRIALGCRNALSMNHHLVAPKY
jgi:hypothetical protein